MPKCKECGREIVWVKNKETGSTLPLDASAPTYVMAKNLFGEPEAVPSDARVSHYSTCSKTGRDRFSAGNPLRSLKSELARGT